MFRRRMAVPAVVVIAALIEFGLIVAGGSGVASAAGPCGTNGAFSQSGTTATCTYTIVGEDTFTVPPGVTSAQVTAWGAAGGSSNIGTIDQANGGLGGETTGTLTSLSNGESIDVEVGGVGGDALAVFQLPGGAGAGGFNGGAAGSVRCDDFDMSCGLAGAGGGGASDLRVGGNALSDRVLVAGGGGGAGNAGLPASTGGAGGGTVGGNGVCGSGGPVACGGDSSESCAGPTSNPCGGAGGNQTGSMGSGQLGSGSPGNPVFAQDGGGGGGYYGGGGGGFTSAHSGDHGGGGGGGGSGFFETTVVTGGTTTSGVQTGDGKIKISWTLPLPTSRDQCRNGGWKTFGVFKNQGDCVSFVATGGKNPPSGS